MSAMWLGTDEPEPLALPAFESAALANVETSPRKRARRANNVSLNGLTSDFFIFISGFTPMSIFSLVTRLDRPQRAKYSRYDLGTSQTKRGQKPVHQAINLFATCVYSVASTISYINLRETRFNATHKLNRFSTKNKLRRFICFGFKQLII